LGVFPRSDLVPMLNRHGQALAPVHNSASLSTDAPSQMCLGDTFQVSLVSKSRAIGTRLKTRRRNSDDDHVERSPPSSTLT
jgi:hypothetical protein